MFSLISYNPNYHDLDFDTYNRYNQYKNVLYAVLFILKCPIYIVVILLYTYVAPLLDKKIQIIDTISIVLLLLVYMIDHILSPNKIRKLLKHY